MKPKPLSGSLRRVFGEGCEEEREGLWKEGGRGGRGGWSEGVFEGLRAREARNIVVRLRVGNLDLDDLF